MRPQQLPDDVDILRFVDAASTMGRSPEMPCAHSAARSSAVAECLGRGTQRRIGVQHRIGQSLEQLRFVGPDTEVMQLDLRLRPGSDRARSNTLGSLYLSARSNT